MVQYVTYHLCDQLHAAQILDRVLVLLASCGMRVPILYIPFYQQNLKEILTRVRNYNEIFHVFFFNFYIVKHILPFCSAFFKCSCCILRRRRRLFCSFTTPYPAPAQSIGTNVRIKHV